MPASDQNEYNATAAASWPGHIMVYTLYSQLAPTDTCSLESAHKSKMIINHIYSNIFT